MNNDFIKNIYDKHLQTDYFPPTSVVCKLITRILLTLFPEQSKKHYKNLNDLILSLESRQKELVGILNSLAAKLDGTPESLAADFMNQLPAIYEDLKKDIEATTQGDPAAKSEYEVIRTYPGFYTIAFYRLAHALYKLNIPLIPRILTEFAHSRTGIDIHPAAEIAPSIFIDHGTGLVIGETAKIGKNVKLYQGVTLGALSVSKDMASKKRHPTIEDNVVIYSGATILGGDTVIGHHSIVGGNVWLTESIPPYSVVYHKAQIEVRKTNRFEV